MNQKMIQIEVDVMSSNLDEVIKNLVNKDNTVQSRLNKNVRFSITLTALQNQRLEIALSKIDRKKQEFISTIIEAALISLEKELNLIDSGMVDSFGNTNHIYKTKYVEEIIKGLGISEEEWDDYTMYL